MKLPSPSQDPFFQRTYLKPLSICIRCPGCRKLYRIDTRDLRSSEPKFDCFNCKTVFTVLPQSSNSRFFVGASSRSDFSAVSLGEGGAQSTVQPYTTRILEKPSEKSFSEQRLIDQSAQTQDTQSLKKCPKCQSFNPSLNKDCVKCGVIFSQLENLPLDRSLGALPSLVRAWQDLMHDYTNLTKHLSFVNQCSELNAIPFALKKYSDLKSTQPQDDIAQQMFHRALIRSLETKTEGFLQKLFQNKWLIKFRVVEFYNKIHWPTVFKYGPLLFSGVLILIGFSSEGLRNLIGFGVSLAFMAIGVAFLLKGRLH